MSGHSRTLVVDPRYAPNRLSAKSNECQKSALCAWFSLKSFGHEAGLCLIFRLYGGHDKSALELFGAEADFVPRLELVQQRRVTDLENHAHGRHVQIFDFPMFDGHLFVFLVDFADFAVRHVSACGWRARWRHDLCLARIFFYGRAGM